MFLLYFFIPVWLGNNNIFYHFTIFLFLAYAFFESFFNREIGIVLTVFIVTLFSFFKSKSNDFNKK